MIAQNTELMQLLNNAQNIYMGIEMAAEKAAEDFLDYKKYFEMGSEKLENLTAELRKYFSIN